MEPTFEVQLKIRKPVSEVFEAVVNPRELSGYFTQEARGRLEEGATVWWRFAEAEGEFPVQVRQVVRNERIVLEWESGEGGYDTTVEMRFAPLPGDETMVQIRESGWRDTPEGVASSYDNCGGWMHMMCCLKAHLEYGINLREGGAR
ncbi:MAG TPA: SRPBCC family protein [Gemmatimonadaceae bacterium]|nr:SRPBCC family protein [Gemmatimonadaceae bacterium]